MKSLESNTAYNVVSEKFFTPLCRQVPYSDPIRLFNNFADNEWSILLGGNKCDKQYPKGTNRYTYIVTSPFMKVRCINGKIYKNDQLISDTIDPLTYIQTISQNFKVQPIKGFPAFQGGMLGLLAYDLCDTFEDIQLPEGSVNPSLMVGFYDLVHIFDHEKMCSWVFSTGLPYEDIDDRQSHASSRLNEYLNMIAYKSTDSDLPISLQQKITIESNFTKSGYVAAVERAIQYIKEGDIFEVNLSQRFNGKLPDEFSAYSLFKRLYKINPCPFAAFANFGDVKILSSSPERFIRVDQGEVETRPIKGTRKRGMTHQEDSRLIDELINSEKDRAENIMIVDLMRNDLSRVCEKNSVNVESLCMHEQYPNVHHLVSVIKGHLQKDKDVFDLLKASFPGGSITGAPKIRAMEIISELEPHNRGPYCGNLMIASFDGQSMDSSILIRTYVINKNAISFHGGGAVTIASDPYEEYEETLSKIQALKLTLESSL